MYSNEFFCFLKPYYVFHVINIVESDPYTPSLAKIIPSSTHPFEYHTNELFIVHVSIPVYICLSHHLLKQYVFIFNQSPVLTRVSSKERASPTDCITWTIGSILEFGVTYRKGQRLLSLSGRTIF